MDLWDFLDDGDGRDADGFEHETEIEDEKSNSKYDRETYINRAVIFSNEYERKIASLGEDERCTRKILETARKILEHHHGDRYEDLYYIDSATNETLGRTDYRVNEREVLPTKAMKKMALGNPNIISIHNHPESTLPSAQDIISCHCIEYKYGLVVCHNGMIYQYSTTDPLMQIYNAAYKTYYKNEAEITQMYEKLHFSEKQRDEEYARNFQRFVVEAKNANVSIKEVKL